MNLCDLSIRNVSTKDGSITRTTTLSSLAKTSWCLSHKPTKMQCPRSSVAEDNASLILSYQQSISAPTHHFPVSPYRQTAAQAAQDLALVRQRSQNFSTTNAQSCAPYMVGSREVAPEVWVRSDFEQLGRSQCSQHGPFKSVPKPYVQFIWIRNWLFFILHFFL